MGSKHLFRVGNEAYPTVSKELWVYYEHRIKQTKKETSVRNKIENQSTNSRRLDSEKNVTTVFVDVSSILLPWLSQFVLYIVTIKFGVKFRFKFRFHLTIKPILLPTTHISGPSSSSSSSSVFHPDSRVKNKKHHRKKKHRELMLRNVRNLH